MCLSCRQSSYSRHRRLRRPRTTTLSNKPGSGAGTKEDPFGLADLPKPDNKPTRPLTVLQPGDTLWFKGGEYALHTGPVKNFYAVGYLRPARSGEPGKPISFRACPGERVVLTAASGGQPIFGNLDRDYVRHEGFVVKGSIGHVGGKGAEVAYCEIIGEYVDTVDNHDGLRIEQADGAWIHHNIIHGVQGKSGNSAGIKVYKSQNLVVEDNWIYDNTRGVFDKDSGINNTYRRNFLTGNRENPFHGNNQGKYMVARIYDNVIDGGIALGYLTDGTEVYNNLIRGDVLAGHWAGELWNTRLWNNIVVAKGKQRHGLQRVAEPVRQYGRQETPRLHGLQRIHRPSEVHLRRVLPGQSPDLRHGRDAVARFRTALPGGRGRRRDLQGRAVVGAAPEMEDCGPRRRRRGAGEHRVGSEPPALRSGRAGFQGDYRPVEGVAMNRSRCTFTLCAGSLAACLALVSGRRCRLAAVPGSEPRRYLGGAGLAG